MNLTFNLVGETVRFGLGTYINKRLSKLLGNQGTLCNATGGNAGNDIYVAPVFVHHVDEALTDESAYLGIGKCDAVIAINRRFATRGPCERVLVVEFYCFDLQ